MDGSPLSEISEAPNKHIREAEEHKVKQEEDEEEEQLAWSSEGPLLYVPVYIAACMEN